MTDPKEFADFVIDSYTQSLGSRTYPERLAYMLWYYNTELADMYIEDEADLREAFEAARYPLALHGILVDIMPVSMPVVPEPLGHGTFTLARTEEYALLTVYDYDRLRGEPQPTPELDPVTKQVAELCVALLAPAFRLRHHITIDRQGMYELYVRSNGAGVEHERKPIGFEEFDQVVCNGWDYWLECGVVATEYYNLYAVDLDRIGETEARVAMRAARPFLAEL